MHDGEQGFTGGHVGTEGVGGAAELRAIVGQTRREGVAITVGAGDGVAVAIPLIEDRRVRIARHGGGGHEVEGDGARRVAVSHFHAGDFPGREVRALGVGVATIHEAHLHGVARVEEAEVRRTVHVAGAAVVGRGEDVGRLVLQDGVARAHRAVVATGGEGRAGHCGVGATIDADFHARTVPVVVFHAPAVAEVQINVTSTADRDGRAVQQGGHARAGFGVGLVDLPAARRGVIAERCAGEDSGRGGREAAVTAGEALVQQGRTRAGAGRDDEERLVLRLGAGRDAHARAVDEGRHRRAADRTEGVRRRRIAFGLGRHLEEVAAAGFFVEGHHAVGRATGQRQGRRRQRGERAAAGGFFLDLHQARAVLQVHPQFRGVIAAEVEDPVAGARRDEEAIHAATEVFAAVGRQHRAGVETGHDVARIRAVRIASVAGQRRDVDRADVVPDRQVQEARGEHVRVERHVHHRRVHRLTSRAEHVAHVHRVAGAGGLLVFEGHRHAGAAGVDDRAEGAAQLRGGVAEHFHRRERIHHLIKGDGHVTHVRAAAGAHDLQGLRSADAQECFTAHRALAGHAHRDFELRAVVGFSERSEGQAGAVGARDGHAVAIPLIGHAAAAQRRGAVGADREGRKRVGRQAQVRGLRGDRHTGASRGDHRAEVQRANATGRGVDRVFGVAGQAHRDAQVVAAAAFLHEAFHVVLLAGHEVDRAGDVRLRSTGGGSHAFAAATTTSTHPFTAVRPHGFTRDFHLVRRIFIRAHEQAATVIRGQEEHVRTGLGRHEPAADLGGIVFKLVGFVEFPQADQAALARRRLGGRNRVHSRREAQVVILRHVARGIRKAHEVHHRRVRAQRIVARHFLHVAHRQRVVGTFGLRAGGQHHARAAGIQRRRTDRQAGDAVVGQALRRGRFHALVELQRHLREGRIRRRAQEHRRRRDVHRQGRRAADRRAELVGHGAAEHRAVIRRQSHRDGVARAVGTRDRLTVATPLILVGRRAVRAHRKRHRRAAHHCLAHRLAHDRDRAQVHEELAALRSVEVTRRGERAGRDRLLPVRKGRAAFRTPRHGTIVATAAFGIGVFQVVITSGQRLHRRDVALAGTTIRRRILAAAVPLRLPRNARLVRRVLVAAQVEITNVIRAHRKLVVASRRHVQQTKDGRAEAFVGTIVRQRVFKETIALHRIGAFRRRRQHPLVERRVQHAVAILGRLVVNDMNRTGFIALAVRERVRVIDRSIAAGGHAEAGHRVISAFRQRILRVQPVGVGPRTRRHTRNRHTHHVKAARNQGRRIRRRAERHQNAVGIAAAGRMQQRERQRVHLVILEHRRRRRTSSVAAHRQTQQRVLTERATRAGRHPVTRASVLAGEHRPRHAIRADRRREHIAAAHQAQPRVRIRRWILIRRILMLAAILARHIRRARPVGELGLVGPARRLDLQEKMTAVFRQAFAHHDACLRVVTVERQRVHSHLHVKVSRLGRIRIRKLIRHVPDVVASSHDRDRAVTVFAHRADRIATDIDRSETAARANDLNRVHRSAETVTKRGHRIRDQLKRGASDVFENDVITEIRIAESRIQDEAGGIGVGIQDVGHAVDAVGAVAIGTRTAERIHNHVVGRISKTRIKIANRDTHRTRLLIVGVEVTEHQRAVTTGSGELVVLLTTARTGPGVRARPGHSSRRWH